MTTVVVPVVVLIACGFAGYWGGIWIGPRFGIDTRHGRSTQRPPLWLGLAVATGIASFAAWAILHGDAALGLGLVVTVVVLPQFVLIALQIRRSSRRSKETSDASGRIETKPKLP